MMEYPTNKGNMFGTPIDNDTSCLKQRIKHTKENLVKWKLEIQRKAKQGVKSNFSYWITVLTVQMHVDVSAQNRRSRGEFKEEDKTIYYFPELGFANL